MESKVVFFFVAHVFFLRTLTPPPLPFFEHVIFGGYKKKLPCKDPLFFEWHAKPSGWLFLTIPMYSRRFLQIEETYKVSCQVCIRFALKITPTKMRFEWSQQEFECDISGYVSRSCFWVHHMQMNLGRKTRKDANSSIGLNDGWGKSSTWFARKLNSESFKLQPRPSQVRLPTFDWT